MSYSAGKTSTDVTIPEGIVRICANAFANSGIASISLPCSLEFVETMAFAGCKNIKSMIFRSNLKSIEKGAFNGCEGLRSICFDDGGKNDLVLEPELFSMLNIEKVYLPNNLKEIPYRTFYKCVMLRNVNLPSKLEKIGIRSFEECVSLKSIQIPESTVLVDERAFQSCSDLVRVEFLSSCSELGIGVFAYCSNLRGIIIPQGAKSYYRQYTDIDFWLKIKERTKGKLHF